MNNSTTPRFWWHVQLTRVKNVAFLHTFDLRYGAQDGVERADAQRVVVWNGQTVVTWGIRFQNHITPS